MSTGATTLLESTAATAVIRDQQLNLRVMRLARPKFCDTTTWAVDPADATSVDIARAVCVVTGQESVEYPVGEFLMAPQSIDVVYIGETFTFYVAVINESARSCTDVCLQAYIQMHTQQIVLKCTLQDANATIPASGQLGEILTHEITELGQHILSCSVSYTTTDGERMSFKKYFKFPVHQPIDVRTKFCGAEDYLSNDVYLEAQIKNLCSTPMILERVVLDATELYTSHPLGLPPVSAATASSDSDEDGEQFLEPCATRQYIFRLTPRAGESAAAGGQLRGVSSIGVLDMSWRTAMGERGRLKTSPLQRMAPGYGDLRLSIEKIPRKVFLQTPFSVVFKLHNSCERSLDLVLTIDETLQPALIFCSVSGQRLGQVLPSSSIEFGLNFLPIASGVQDISGLRLTDLILRRTYEHDDIAQILVT